MKKKLLFLFALICSVSIFSSCGDDDKDTTWTQIPDATKENTKLTINGGTLPDATASLDIQSAEAAVLKLTNAIYGHDDISVNVAMVKSNDSTYVFEGTANLDGAISKATEAVDKGLTVTAKGTVTTSGKLTVDVTTSGWGTLSGVYSGDSLKMTVNGEEAKLKKPVTVTAQSETKATLVFEQIPNVANDFEMEVTLAKDGEGYKFEGTKDLEEGYHVAVSGTIVKNVMTITITTSGYATLNSIFFNLGTNFDCTLNGKALSTGYIDFNFKSEKAVDITLNGLIPGIYHLNEDDENINEIKDVTYTKAADSETYSFSGSFAPEGFKNSTTITFEGTISPEKKLTLALTRTIKSDIVGKWTMATTSEGSGKIFVDFKSATGTVTIPDSIYNFVPENLKSKVPQKFTDQEFIAGISQLLGQYTTFLKSIEFKATGDVEVVYSKVGEGATEHTLEGYMYFSVSDQGKLIITPSMEKLLGSLLPSTASTLKSYDPWDASGLLNGAGVPLNYKGNGSELLVTLDNGGLTGTTTFASQMIPLLEMFAPMLPAQFAEMIPMLKVIIPGADGMLKEMQALEIGLYLKK